MADVTDLVGMIGNANGTAAPLDITGLGKKPLAQAADKSSSFEEYLLNALNVVNEAQNKSSGIAEQLITDPDSVDIHDVTIAMAEAKMTLDIAQGVIDRMLTAWNDITTTR
jgi:flagellar hook-basal body complex protein FliE